MSVAAMTWAFGLDLKPATAKFVLVALADNADDQGRAFPSVAALVGKTSLDRKTVIASLDQLEHNGVLADTAERVGRTRQVKVYRLVGFNTANSPENGTGPENGTVPNFPSKSTVFPMKEYRKRDTESSGNHQRTQRRSVQVRDEPAPPGLVVEVWLRWEAYRREIRKPIKPASLLAAQRKLAGFGADQAAVVEQSIANGWQGLFALKPPEKGARREASEWM